MVTGHKFNLKKGVQRDMSPTRILEEEVDKPSQDWIDSHFENTPEKHKKEKKQDKDFGLMLLNQSKVKKNKRKIKPPVHADSMIASVVPNIYNEMLEINPDLLRMSKNTTPLTHFNVNNENSFSKIKEEPIEAINQIEEVEMDSDILGAIPNLVNSEIEPTHILQSLDNNDQLLSQPEFNTSVRSPDCSSSTLNNSFNSINKISMEDQAHKSTEADDDSLVNTSNLYQIYSPILMHQSYDEANQQKGNQINNLDINVNLNLSIIKSNFSNDILLPKTSSINDRASCKLEKKVNSTFENLVNPSSNNNSISTSNSLINSINKRNNQIEENKIEIEEDYSCLTNGEIINKSTSTNNSEHNIVNTKCRKLNGTVGVNQLINKVNLTEDYEIKHENDVKMLPRARRTNTVGARLSLCSKLIYIINTLNTHPAIYCLMERREGLRNLGDIENDIFDDKYESEEDLFDDLIQLLKSYNKNILDNYVELDVLDSIEILSDIIENIKKLFVSNGIVPDKGKIEPLWEPLDKLHDLEYNSKSLLYYIKIVIGKSLIKKFGSERARLYDGLNQTISDIIDNMSTEDQYFGIDGPMIKLYVIRNRTTLAASSIGENSITILETHYNSSHEKYLLIVKPLGVAHKIQTDLDLDSPKAWIYAKVLRIHKMDSHLGLSTNHIFEPQLISKNNDRINQLKSFMDSKAKE